MKLNLLYRFVSLLLISLLAFGSGCYSVTRTEADAIFDSNLKKNNLKIARVAIIPNRLPLTIKEGEKWRVFNYEVISALFRSRGFEVVNYDTTVEAFRKSNLPMEDTASSEEKFAMTASKLDADILIMPYYNTDSNNSNYVIWQNMSYNTTVSLQIYSIKENKFIFRTEITGKSDYNIIGVTLSSLITPIVNAASSDKSGVGSAISIGAILVVLAFLIGDIVNASTSVDTWWQRSFSKAVEGALEPFFATYSKPN